MKLYCRLFQWGCLLTLLLIFNSCSYENVEFRRAEHFKLVKLEGRSMQCTFDAVLKNPNNYTIKIKPTDLDLYINDTQVGVIKLDDKVKIVKKTDGSVTLPITAELSNGALPKLIAAALKPKVEVRIVGTVKGVVGIFSKKKNIDETREISLRDLNIPFLNN